MKFNKFTLAFPKAQEDKFQVKYFNDSLFQFRFSFVLLIFLYGIFGLLDSHMTTEHTKLFHQIRFLVVIPFMGLVFLFSFNNNFKKIWQTLILISFILGGIGLIIMSLKSTHQYIYIAGIMLVISAGFFFVQLRFFIASIGSWLLVLLFNIAAIWFSSMDTVMIIGSNFLYISANLIGMFASYHIEYFTRNDFYQKQQIDIQSREINDANINLENKITQRTRELMNAKNLAEQSDILKTAFLANMSHEIRTPMNGILGFMDLLQDPELEKEERESFMEIMNESGERLLNTINDIIEFSQIEADQKPVEYSDISIYKELNYLHAFFKPEADKKGLAFHFNMSPEDDRIFRIDQKKLESILINLLKNALKFTTKGYVEFGMNVENELLIFFVKDSGIGIPAGKLELIFQRFMQVELELTRQYEGSGLGLSISKAYTELMGGKIWVESEHEKGTSFYVAFDPNIENKSS